MEQFILHDGTVIEGAAGLAENYLWLWFKGYTFSEVYSLFSNPEKTASIDYHFGEMNTLHEGYTDLRAISFDSGDFVSVCLRKAVNNA